VRPGAPHASFRPRRAVLALACLALCAGLAGCGGGQSILAPRSHQTHLIALLWWWMLGAAAVVFVGAVALLVLGWVRRGKSGLPVFGQREDLAGGMVIGFGIVIPLVVLIALFAASDLYVIRTSAAPVEGSTSMTIDVVGHQWWWEVRYPGTSAVTANEVHIPVDARVAVVATTADVIHSLWVPRLARKIDMIPGRKNRVLLQASSAGRYVGQCSEFCGLAHSQMRLAVVAEPRGSFQAWLQNTERPALAPTGAQANEGERLFVSRGCASCHQLRGTPAQTTIGPDLTHLASRATIGALSIPENRAELEAWIRDPQAIKPGNHMPDLGLSRAETSALAVFLQGLR
jgi:cytochrome c oxidase subunit II